MRQEGFSQVLASPPEELLQLFLETANRLGTTVQHIEKDFWVCWTLSVLYGGGLPAGGPRLLFKGGTSLSKGFGLIQRFSEDIDITVFRDDLGIPAPLDTMEALSRKKREAQLNAIRDACQKYIVGSLRELLAETLRAATRHLARSTTSNVDVDPEDGDRQTLLIWYPSVTTLDSYVRPAVKIEAGAKSALDPHRQVRVAPYVAKELPDVDLTTPDVTVIEATRTFWDKVVIVHGLRRWHELRGELRQAGQRVSRHSYDLHCLWNSAVGQSAAADLSLGDDCVRHAKMFFDRKDLDLASAKQGSFAIAPAGPMLAALEEDYARMRGMIFGAPPAFAEVMASVNAIHGVVNR